MCRSAVDLIWYLILSLSQVLSMLCIPTTPLYDIELEFQVCSDDLLYVLRIVEGDGHRNRI